ncbi:MAG TPA: O-antigen translocase [Sphingobacteriaceae bacterium]
MTDSKKKSYRNIIKGTAIFGGVQIFQILLTILKGKLVAVLLGPAGSGIAALFISTTNIITQFSGLGLSFSAVRDIAQANEVGDQQRMSRTIKVFRRWVWFTGLLGGVICLIFAKEFSKFAFDTTKYSWGFVWLSVSLLLNALSTGDITLLQGTRQLQNMAKATVYGSGIGLILAFPCYYYWHLSGIVPAIIAASVASFIVNRYFARKIKLPHHKLTLKETFTTGQQMARLGIVLMISQVIGTVVTYVVNTFISQRGGIVDVGLFQSGTMITNHSLGLVFTAMAVDYFPRLSAVADDTLKLRDLVNQQCIMVTLIITPLLISLILFAPLLIRVLLSVEYVAALPLVQWVSLGMLLKAASYALGYVSFAKGDKRTFFWLEGIFGNALTLTFNTLGYSLLGIEGLGMSFFASYAIYMVVLIVVVYKKYNFRFYRDFFFIFILQIVICLAVFSLVRWADNMFTLYTFGITLLAAATYYSWRELDKLIDIKDLLNKKLKSSLVT